ncbi:MAG: hypothetical protein KJ573_07300 [Proteobacteria bacterium]|nr:hypothetical protein [Pseudomonadota bacterium]
MEKRGNEDRRSHVGYGSSYRKGSTRDLSEKTGIGAVLGGQVWMVEPDQHARASNPCIWMQAGAVKFKDCNNFYDCTTCKYDLGMEKRVGAGKQIHWQDAMRKRGGLQRICRHSLANRIGKRACAYDYQCATCDFDQFFEDVWTTKTESRPQEVQEIKGFKLPRDYFFHNGHTWVRIESGGYVRVGMDDFSQKLLGGADAFELPLMGKVLDRDNAGWGLKRTGNRADVLSPVDGIIVEVNSRLREKPQIVREKPYEAGWLFMVHTPDVKSAAKKLMADAESFEWMNKEVSKLEGMIEEVSGPLPADGGYLAEDIFGNLPDLGWTRLTKTFLRV